MNDKKPVVILDDNCHDYTELEQEVSKDIKDKAKKIVKEINKSKKKEILDQSPEKLLQ